MEEAELNLFRRAKHLLDKKDGGSELSKEEKDLVWAAITPVLNMPGPDMTISEGLELLARMVEEETSGKEVSYEQRRNLGNGSRRGAG